MILSERKTAFTLTEILLSVTIVGIIAALVLPAVITHFQDSNFNIAIKRETNAIKQAISSLAVNENKASFFETMMYTATEPENYENSAELFLKKYLRVSKICKDNYSECFADKYFYFDENDKKVYTPDFKGACASLKNGMSICLTPQVGSLPITGIIDLNGKKGPNVLNKDLRLFTVPIIAHQGRNTSVAAVLETPFTPINLDEEENNPCEGMTCGCGDLPPCDPCEGLTCGCGDLPECPKQCSDNPNDWDEDCCEANKSSISTGHSCCFYSKFSHTEACGAKYLTFNVDYECYYRLYSYKTDSNNNKTNTTYSLGGDGCNLKVYSNEIPADATTGCNLEFRIIPAQFLDLNNLSGYTTMFFADIVNGKWYYNGNAPGNMYSDDISVYGGNAYFPTGTIENNPLPYIAICDGSCYTSEDIIDLKQLNKTYNTPTSLYRLYYEGRNLKIIYYVHP